jgi:hypothetical protein
VKTTTVGQTQELAQQLDRLESLHRRLLEIINRKIEAMRRSDIDEIRACLDPEAALVQQIAEQEGRRKRMVGQMGQQLGLSPSRARTVNLRRLADRLPPEQRPPLLHATDRLRTAVAKVAERNRVAGVIAREILRHFRHVFSAMTSGGGPGPESYTHHGQRQTVAPKRLLDAVG